MNVALTMLVNLIIVLAIAGVLWMLVGIVVPPPFLKFAQAAVLVVALILLLSLLFGHFHVVAIRALALAPALWRKM